jgi:hypothetical protein
LNGDQDAAKKRFLQEEGQLKRENNGCKEVGSAENHHISKPRAHTKSEQGGEASKQGAKK